MIQTMTRSFLAASCLTALPAFAGSLCAAPAPVMQTTQTPVTPATQIVAADGDALARLTGSGSTIDWQAGAYGLDVGVLRSAADQVMVFMTPRNHRYVIGGTVIPVPYARLHDLMRKRATDLEPVLGVTGMFVTEGNRFRILYATPDGQAAIAGTLWDAVGKNITRDQIRFIPGAVPTVSIDTPSGSGQLPPGKITAGSTGVLSAPEVLMFIDPRCMYSIRAMSELQPAVDAGKIRLKIVPLSLLDYEDHGASTLYANAMLSQPASKMVTAWTSGALDDQLSKPSPSAPALLAGNMTAARAVSIAGTPTFFWKHANGTVGRLDGVPPDIAAFVLGVAQ